MTDYEPGTSDILTDIGQPAEMKPWFPDQELANVFRRLLKETVPEGFAVSTWGDYRGGELAFPWGMKLSLSATEVAALRDFANKEIHHPKSWTK